MTYPVDIIIPVWNRPVETRACLAALVENSPEARIIMVNYGSERETERILDEFADALDERAMLVSTGRNVGRVAALNHGIRLSSAPLVVLVQDEVRITGDWLAPMVGIMEEYPDVGLAIPSNGRKKPHVATGSVPFREVDHGSLGVMVLRRELHAAIGGLDENMDGALWCLRDYSRRAERAGYRTVCAMGCALEYHEPPKLGSLLRREERCRSGEMLYRQRWGAEHHFCFALTGPETGRVLDGLLPAILKAVRMGDRITILGNGKIAGKLFPQGSFPGHANLSVEIMPALFTGRAVKKRVARLAEAFPEMIFMTVSGVDEHDLRHTFTRMVEERRLKYFAEKGDGDAVSN